VRVRKEGFCVYVVNKHASNVHKLFLYIDSYKRGNSTRLQGYMWNALLLVWNLQAASDNCAASYSEMCDFEL